LQNYFINVIIIIFNKFTKYAIKIINIIYKHNSYYQNNVRNKNKNKKITLYKNVINILMLQVQVNQDHIII
jgi:hypothetical protein